MPSQVATAYVQIIPSAQGIGGGIAQALGGDAAATSAGKSIGGKLVKTIKGVIAAAGIGAALGKALTEGAALEQSLGGVETLFKDSADQVIAAADNAYRTAGVSANDYMQQVTSFSATLLQGLGGDTEAAAKYADQAIVQMADNANKMGTDISSIQMAYQGFAKDNYDMLDNLKLGYGGTQAEMARLINDSGVLGDTIKVTDKTVRDVPFDKIIEAIGVIQDDLGITGTTAQEAATTLSGSFASMQAAFSNVLANLTLGRDLGPALDGLAQAVTTFISGNLLPALWNILSALPGALVTFVTSLGPQLVTGLQELLENITGGMDANLLQTGTEMVSRTIQGISQALPGVISAGGDILTNIVTGITTMMPSLLDSAVTVINDFVNMVIENLPAILDAGAQVLQSLVAGCLSMIGDLRQSVAEIIINFVATVVQNLPQIIESGLNLLASFIRGIGDGFPDLVAKTGEIISMIWDAVTSIDWPQLGIDIVSGLINGLGSMGGALRDAATNIARSALDAIKSFFGIASPSKLMQFEIGPYIPQGLALGIEKNASFVDDAMNDLSARSYASMRTALTSGAPGTGTVPARPGLYGTADTAALLQECVDLLRLILDAVYGIHIGDETIGRANARYQADRNIMMGGAF